MDTQSISKIPIRAIQKKKAETAELRTPEESNISLSHVRAHLFELKRTIK